MAAECGVTVGISANPALGGAPVLSEFPELCGAEPSLSDRCVTSALADKFGCPTLKISTNSDLARRMPDLIDFDTGPIIRGQKTVEQMGKDMLELVIATASGTYAPKAVSLGQDDFLPWKRGVSL